MNFRKLFQTLILIGFSVSAGTGLCAQSAVELLEQELTAPGIVLMDYNTGRILFERNGESVIPPASMTKVMTLFLTYEAIEKGQLKKEDLITIDEAGSSFSRPPFSSLMLLEEGQTVTVLDLMRGLAVSSGNDAAYALAHILGPGKEAFIDKMNGKARELGLKKTRFVDPDGWSEYNSVSPRDFAILSRSYIQKYPEALTELHSLLFMVYPLPGNMPEGIEFQIQVPRKKRNTNLLLERFEGVDGLKTGYIDESGFNFTATALREGQRLISVIMGIRTESYYQGIRRRAEETEVLLNFGFKEFIPQTLKAPEIPDVRVWFSRDQYIEPLVRESAAVMLGFDEKISVYSQIHLNENLRAPLAGDTIIGSVDYYLGETFLGSADILTSSDVPEGSFIQKLRDYILRWWEDRTE
ncbi:D-alanyl-D-alanine carboxypeptidase family protein [Oceanispirochaeta sp.]|jgi:D-alanyl-D-alanine carboxypeptidase (penicillin-binding protein 5/6)|uniref:D-alanyl-D-alanine carboxypeptidase family protein n=1 Tax=Oceanispirochaeta sp. TaxID=2035350 RepID=UPI00262B9025|nr:D-alanyl-D-alanine carboxypeptidase family protein [Oceanispirochaeta sp.]MDA3957952.1 D-alanyl-D-alanine carboxypeptidase [Oceanispirochaeta sp.]